jgi:Beta-carotene isomerase D27-like, C-terminal
MTPPNQPPANPISSPAASPLASQPPISPAAAEKTVYNDNWIDQAFIRLFAHKMARAVGQGTPLKGYDGFVYLSQQIMQGRNSEQQQATVAVVLQSLVPMPALWVIRKVTRPTQLVCELNAWFATQLFVWLVGPCEVRSVEVPVNNSQPHGPLRAQRSGVYIEKCRYLEQSGCVGMCINMCKLPTQKFFTEDFGIPLTMVPNFEDLSCEMIFGQAPPPLETEDAYHQPCLLTQCETASPRAVACPKVRE